MTMAMKYLRVRETVIDLLGGCCQSCGSEERLEFHHPDGNPARTRTGLRGGYLNALDALNTIRRRGKRAIRLLCHDCHAEGS